MQSWLKTMSVDASALWLSLPGSAGLLMWLAAIADIGLFEPMIVREIWLGLFIAGAVAALPSYVLFWNRRKTGAILWCLGINSFWVAFSLFWLIFSLSFDGPG
jgi:hypothetical protein